jgi:hypothetical protein
MRKLSTPEVARLTATEVESLNDLCDIYHFNGTADSLGEITNSWDTGTFSVACGFQEQIAKQARSERGQVVVIDVAGLLRVPTTQSMNVQDKVMVRSNTYYVDNILPGLTVHICELVKDFHAF